MRSSRWPPGPAATSPRLCCDHLTREPLDHVRAAGLEVEELRRSKLRIVERLQARKRG
ncbi:MAG TPA: hypothetical protein VGR10_04550 [Thermoleophilaceae bacterium]|nr:hypothetical protein [Thermoleophilaceae bacterium]